jgi:DHA2 family multidrug resistance protein-like MFS transporter
VFSYQYLQLVVGLSPLHAGLWTVPSFGAFLVGSLLVPVIVQRIRPGIVMAGGMALAAVGYGLLSRITGPSDLALFTVSEVLSSLGLIPVVVLATDLVVGNAPPERAGAAAALSETGAELGGALGIAMLGTLGAAIYHHQMAGAIASGLPPEVAAAARETLAGAVAGAGQVPDQLAVVLLSMARGAFVQGLQIVATTAALLAVTVAAIAAIMLRNVGVGPESEVKESMTRTHGKDDHIRSGRRGRRSSAARTPARGPTIRKPPQPGQARIWSRGRVRMTRWSSRQPVVGGRYARMRSSQGRAMRAS